MFGNWIFSLLTSMGGCSPGSFPTQKVLRIHDLLDGCSQSYCWWFRNPGSTHQLRLAVYDPIIYKGFITIPGACLGFLNHQQYHIFSLSKTWISSEKVLNVFSQNDGLMVMDPMVKSKKVTQIQEDQFFFLEFEFECFQHSLKNISIKFI